MQVTTKSNLRDGKKAVAAPKESASSSDVKLGITPANTTKVCDMLRQTVVDSYALLAKTQNYHWNVKGPMFKQVHELTELLYNQIFSNIDVIAERVRALGQDVPASVSIFAERTQLSEPNLKFTASQMVSDLVKDNEWTAKQLRKGVALSDDAEDVATADLLTNCIAGHEKFAWMLRSLLE